MSDTDDPTGSQPMAVPQTGSDDRLRTQAGGAGRLAGRRVLVTGASSGIGAATARAVVAAGGRVGLVARRQDRLAALAADLGPQAVVAATDVTDPVATVTAVRAVAEAFEGLDAVVAAAGIARPGEVEHADPSDWRAMVEVNLLGVLHTVQPAIPVLRDAGRGDVVLVGSMSGRRLKSAPLGVYAGTKAALAMLGEGLRLELAPHGTRVTTVAPGLVDTSIFGDRDDPTSERLRSRAPEVGLSADDVADTIVDVMAAPRHVLHVEVMLQSLAQRADG